jgi:hypothetical protein
MNYQEIITLVASKFQPDEVYQGAFKVLKTPPMLFRLLLGYIYSFTVSHYVIVASDRNLYFVKLNIFEKVEIIDVFSYSEIKKIESTCKATNDNLKFWFRNGNELFVNAFYEGGKVKTGVLSLDLLSCIEEKTK